MVQYSDLHLIFTTKKVCYPEDYHCSSADRKNTHGADATFTMFRSHGQSLDTVKGYTVNKSFFIYRLYIKDRPSLHV